MEMVVAIGALVLGIGLGLFVASAREDAARRTQRRLERLKADQKQRLEQLKDELTSEHQAGEDELKQSIQEARAERAIGFKSKKSSSSRSAPSWTRTGKNWRKTRSRSTEERV